MHEGRTLTSITGFGSQVGAMLTFNTHGKGPTAIFARAGVSFISSEQACANAEAEIPDYDFDGIHQASRAAWNDILSRFQVKTDHVPSNVTELFYSSIYRTHISPADCECIPSSASVSRCRQLKKLLLDTGENPRWNSTEPYYDSLYCNVRPAPSVPIAVCLH